jgi:uncharacterized protein
MRRRDRAITDTQDIDSILARGLTCQLAMVDSGHPYLVSLNYGYRWVEGRPFLYFHCAREGRKIEALRRSPEACWTVAIPGSLKGGPEACSWGMGFESVVGIGRVRFLEGQEARAALDALMERHIALVASGGLSLISAAAGDVPSGDAPAAPAAPTFSGRPSLDYNPGYFAKTQALVLETEGFEAKRKA